jgi:putative transposase
MQTITILALIAPIRHLMSQYGVKKVYLDIKDNLVKNNIKMGRDQFFKFMRTHKLLIRKSKL